MQRADLSLINEPHLLNGSSGRYRLFHPEAHPAFCAHLPAHLKEIALYGYSIKVFRDGKKNARRRTKKKGFFFQA